MTTRAGLAGLLTGLTVTLILVYPLAIDRQTTTPLAWMAFIAAVVAVIGGGALAGRWIGSVHPVRCAALGSLAGGLAGAIVFCLLGAAWTGLTVSASSRVECIVAMIERTQTTFLWLFLGGVALGLLGGWLACPHRGECKDVFDKSEPQMAMNAAITAVPASIVAAVLSAFIFSRLADSIDERSILDMPLTVSMLLVVISYLALTLVVPHEAREAEHGCGMDEVKMAAYVGIGAAPVLALLLYLVGRSLFLNLQVIIALSAGVFMSLRSLQALFKVILPRRASLSIPQGDRQRIEAALFGTIADSHGPRLIALCIGCGLIMVLPLHVTVISTLINLSVCFGQFTSAEVARKLFLTQSLASIGLAVASIILLIFIYLVYLNLGRWFKKRYSH